MLIQTLVSLVGWKDYLTELIELTREISIIFTSKTVDVTKNIFYNRLDIKW